MLFVSLNSQSYNKLQFYVTLTFENVATFVSLNYLIYIYLSLLKQ